MTKIEWTEATWNPIVGCSLASPGCTNCYAMKMAGRIEATGHAAYQGLTQKAKTGFVWTGKLALNEKALLEPLRWKKPRMIFVNSMGDLFHEDCPDEWIDRVFAVMALCPQHTFQVLTKRSARMREYLTRPAGNGKQNPLNHIAWISVPSVLSEVAPDWTAEAIDGKWRSRGIKACTVWPLPNVWLGVSVEDQKRADERIPDLLATPAAVRWISAEPLLGPVDLRKLTPSLGFGREHWKRDCLTGELLEFDTPISSDQGFGTPPLDWVVVGGESGPGARPMHPDWARSLRDQCAAAGVPFFFKQWGEWYPAFANDFAVDARAVRETIDLDGAIIHRVGKKHAGRLLDGVLHDAMPEPVA